MSSFCHEGAIEKLDHGVLFFVFCITDKNDMKNLCYLVHK